MSFERKKKIGLAGCLLMGIGATGGSGIFGTLPEVAREIGPATILALIGAAVVVILRLIPTIYVSAALPTSGRAYMHATKLLHPIAGALVSINSFLQPIMVSLFGVLFATYFRALFPNFPISDTMCSIGLLVVFTIIAWFGNKNSANVGNLIVILLMMAIALYVVIGMPSISADNISFIAVVKPGIALSSIGAAVGVLTSSLSGATAVAEIADDVEKPERDVPLALILCPLIVAAIYILMSVVTIGVVPHAEVESLAQVAGHFMSPALLTFFIVGGPIAGIITSLIPIALACVQMISFSAKTKFLPEIFCRQNKHGVPVLSLFVVSGIAIGICATGATFGVMMTVFSCVNAIGGLPDNITPIFAHKKYPKCCDNSYMPLGYKLAGTVGIAALAVNFYLIVQMAMTLDKMTVIGVLLAYCIGFLYFFFRLKYLKRHDGLDLMEEMRKPYEPWANKEATYR